MKNKIPKSAITERQLRKLLKEAAGDDSLSAWAVENNITPQAVSAFMRRVQSAGLQIPEVLGYRPQVIYLPLDEEPICHMNPPRRPTKNPSKKVDHSLEPIEKRSLRKKNDREETKKALKKRSRK
jgi:hypothetical protein